FSGDRSIPRRPRPRLSIVFLAGPLPAGLRELGFPAQDGRRATWLVVGLVEFTRKRQCGPAKPAGRCWLVGFPILKPRNARKSGHFFSDVGGDERNAGSPANPGAPSRPGGRPPGGGGIVPRFWNRGKMTAGLPLDSVLKYGVTIPTEGGLHAAASHR